MVKNIQLVLGTLALAALLGGCGKNEAVKATEEWADTVCACKDFDCAMKANLEGAEKIKKYRDARGTKGDLDAMQKATKRLQDCMNEVVKAGVPPAAPTPPPSGAAPATPPAPAPAPPGEAK